MYYSVAASTDLTTRGRWLRSFNICETAGVAAVVNLRDGAVGGPIVVQLRFAAVTGGSDRTATFTHPGINFPGGLYLQVASGTVQAMVDLV